MDIDGVSVEGPIKFGKSKFVTERLDGAPCVDVFESGPSSNIRFGNTGFDIVRGWNSFHFMPEGQIDYSEEKAAKYASMLAVSFLNVYELFNNPEKMAELGIKDGDIGKISALTDDRLINAVKGLFARSKVPGLAHMNKEGYRIVVDLERYKDLGEDDPLIIYLKRVSERAKNMTVTYSKMIQEPQPA